MQRRSLVYIVIMAAVLVVLTRYSGEGAREKVTVPMPPEPLSRQQILRDMSDLKDNRLPIQPVLGGSFLATAVRFASGFSGVAGDKFWVAIEDGHVSYILEYTLGEDTDRSLVYKVSRVIDGSTWPVAKGETYRRGKNGFEKQP